ncbi:MAG: hypothetical protein UT58_C0023G0001, partial [Microgenomates group bacterium GW2011_GWC1_39_7b]
EKRRREKGGYGKNNARKIQGQARKNNRDENKNVKNNRRGNAGEKTGRLKGKREDDSFKSPNNRIESRGQKKIKNAGKRKNSNKQKERTGQIKCTSKDTKFLRNGR